MLKRAYEFNFLVPSLCLKSVDEISSKWKKNFFQNQMHFASVSWHSDGDV